MFTTAIVRKPCRNLIKGLSTANLGVPNYYKAMKQHKLYVEALQSCDLDVHILEANENFPDSVFVEDAALLTKNCAIITNPGAKSREGEIVEMEEVLKKFYAKTEKISSPGTVEAGDIMMVGDHFYIGLSERTNLDGAKQMISILEKNDLTGSTVELNEMLHLKTGLSYLENNNMLVAGEFIHDSKFEKFNCFIIPEEELYAANSLWINEKVLVPEGNPNTKKMIENAGYEVISLDMSEFRKLDGGLSCLSLRF